jgi:hypothetical protein
MAVRGVRAAGTKLHTTCLQEALLSSIALNYVNASLQDAYELAGCKGMACQQGSAAHGQCLLTEAVHDDDVLVVAAVQDKHSEQDPLYCTVCPAHTEGMAD